MTDDRTLEGEACSDQRLHDEMLQAVPPLRWRRAVEVTLYEDEIHAMARLISRRKDRPREEDVIRELIIDGLERAQCLRR